MLMTLFCFALNFCYFVFSVAAQTSDAVMYYIAYDGSGSVAFNDTNNNLQALHNALIKINNENKTIQSNARFELYKFGEKALAVSSYKPPRNKKETQENARKVSEITAGTRKNAAEPFSHIDLVLESIINSIDKEANISKGVFIFTDGLLRKGDFDKSYGTLEVYIKRVDSLIKKIQSLTGKPVFIVQTSYSPTNPFLGSIGVNNIPENLPDGVLHHNNFFWLSNVETYTSGTKIDTAFNKFVNYSNQIILNDREISNNDNIAAAVLTQELISLEVDKLTPDDLTLDVIKVFDNVKKLKKELKGDKDTFNREQIRSIKQKLDELSRSPEVLKYLRKKAQEKANTVDLTLAQVFIPQKPTTLIQAANKSNNLTAEEKIITGLTNYIIDRATQEVLYTFIEAINKKMQGDPAKAAIFKTYLFPNLYSLIKNENYYADPLMIQLAFRKDMDYLPENLLSKELELTEGLAALLAFVDLYEGILLEGSLESAFTRLDTKIREYRLDKRKKIANLKMFSAISFSAKLIGSLRKYNFAEVYRNHPDSLAELSKMLMIIAIDTNNVKQIDLHNASELVGDVYDSYTMIKKQLESFESVLENKPVSDFSGYQKYQSEIVIDIFKRSADIMLSGTKILSQTSYFGVNDEITNKANTREAISDATKAIEAWFALKDGRYSEVSFVFSEEILKLLGKLDKKDSVFYKSVVNIAGEVSTAKSPDDVKNVIAKYTLPVASYRIKYKNSNTIMINAYLGGGGVVYRNDNVKGAVMAPIGLEGSFKVIGRSFSVFAGLLDLGNIINYRISTTDSTKNVVNFERIFSPSLFLRIGLNKSSPFSFIGGYQMNPGRFSLGLAVDMPLIAIWKND